MQYKDTPLGKAYTKAQEEESSAGKFRKAEEESKQKQKEAEGRSLVDKLFSPVENLGDDTKLIISTAAPVAMAAAGKIALNAAEKSLIDKIAKGRLAFNDLMNLDRTIFDTLGRVPEAKTSEWVRQMTHERLSGLVTSVRRADANPTANNLNAVARQIDEFGGKEYITIVRDESGKLKEIKIKPNPKITDFEKRLTGEVKRARTFRKTLQTEHYRGVLAEKKRGIPPTEKGRAKLNKKIATRQAQILDKKMTATTPRQIGRYNGRTRSMFRAMLARGGGNWKLKQN